MDRGEFVPDAVVIGMIGGSFDTAREEGKEGIILTVSRTVAQAEALDRLMEDKDTSIAGVLSLVVDEEELTKRILEPRTHQWPQRRFRRSYHPQPRAGISHQDGTGSVLLCCQ